MAEKKNNGSSKSWVDDYKSEEIMNELGREDQFADEKETSSSYLSSSEDIQRHFLDVQKTTRRTRITALMVVLVGAVASASFLYLGISSVKSDNEDLFERQASDMAKELDGAWDDYESAARWAHSACRNWRTDNFTHEDYEAVYHYLISGGLDFYAIDWIPNITHAEREAIEEREGAFWKTIEGGEGYTGFMGQEPDPENPGELIYTIRSEQPFYFPIYFAEPKNSTVAVIHYDLFSPPWERPAIEKALETHEPALTGRFVLAQHTTEDGYSVLLYHPGVRLPKKFDTGRHDLSTIVINLNMYLKRAARFQSEPMMVYLYDKTLNALDGAAPEFLGGMKVDYEDGDRNKKEVIMLKEIEHADLQGSRFYYERDVQVGARIWTTVVVAVDGTYKEDLVFVCLSGCLIFAASLILAVWMIHNMQKSIALHQVISQAAAEASIVSNLFPANVRERMIQDAELRNNNNARESKKKDMFRNDGNGGERLSKNRLDRMLTVEGIFGSKPIAELHPYTTIMVADLAGFTAWASVREPTQVFTLLELIYHSWDTIAQRRRVYKVETVGDSYVACAGLPEPRKDHAVVMARFCNDCLHRFRSLVKALEKTLGPDTGDLAARFGLHSGQVVAGVLRGDKGRFQLFGDSVNMAARMESTGIRNKIHCSQETADLINQGGHGNWIYAREELVDVKGKGRLQTYTIHPVCGSKASSSPDTVSIAESSGMGNDSKIDRLVEWNVEVLSGLLRSIVARREAVGKRTRKLHTETQNSNMTLEEVVEIITLPEYDANAVKKQVDPATIFLDPRVVEQLKSLVERIAATYRSNPFHNFEHASHVTMSVLKMMGRIVAPKELTHKKSKKGKVDQTKFEAALNDHTFGIASDPLTQFGCAFSALIHDVDHQGVPNTVLVKEGVEIAQIYQNKSVAEQHSVDLAWALLMDSEYDMLRDCICCDDEEFARFRSLVVNSVMATDIMDKELGNARKARWSRAFKTESDDGDIEEDEEETQAKINRKATIVIEHLIQASDVSHTMQHWHVYAKWNQRLFTEMYKAYKAGRLDTDPSEGWYKGEMGFFDFYIIPLAKKLFTCGVFGVSSDEFLNYAITNRKEWEQKGEMMVEKYLKEMTDESEEMTDEHFKHPVEC